jgi:hypothetical protein
MQLQSTTRASGGSAATARVHPAPVQDLVESTAAAATATATAGPTPHRVSLSSTFSASSTVTPQHSSTKAFVEKEQSQSKRKWVQVKHEPRQQALGPAAATARRPGSGAGSESNTEPRRRRSRPSSLTSRKSTRMVQCITSPESSKSSVLTPQEIDDIAVGCKSFFDVATLVLVLAMMVCFLAAVPSYLSRDVESVAMNGITLLTTWAERDFMNSGEDRAQQQLVWFISVFAPLACAAYMYTRRPATLTRIKFARCPRSESLKRVRIAWAGTITMLIIVIVIEWYLNAMDHFQKDRLDFCVIVFIFNVAQLNAVRFVLMKIDNDPNDLLRYSTMFDIQVFVVAVNSTIALLMNMLQNSYPGWSPTAAERAAYQKALQGTGAEAFAFFWVSNIISQGLRLLQDIINIATLLYIRKRDLANGVDPEEHSLFHTAQLFSADRLYGTREAFAPMIQNALFVISFGWINPHVFWLCSIMILSSWVTYTIRIKYFSKGYQGTPSLIPNRFAGLLVMMPMIAVCGYALMLIPLGDECAYLAANAAVSYGLGLVVFLSMRNQTENREDEICSANVGTSGTSGRRASVNLKVNMMAHGMYRMNDEEDNYDIMEGSDHEMHDVKESISDSASDSDHHGNHDIEAPSTTSDSASKYTYDGSGSQSSHGGANADTIQHVQAN